MKRQTILKPILLSFPFLILSCISEQVETPLDCSQSLLEASIDEISNSDCGSANGSLSIAVSGGEAPYIFTSSDIGTSSDGTYSNITAGNYTIEVTDVNGCTDNLTISIQNEEGVNLDELITTSSGCGTDQGSIQVIASNGEAPYSYSLDGGNSQASNEFSELSIGSYDIEVTDASGCESSQSVNILSGVSYQTSIKTIIENNCAISGCHNGNQSPDLRTFSDIQSSAARIKARTGEKTMPKGRTLSQNQIDQIACWVDDGALEN